MKTFNENITLVDFDAWSGAIDTKDRIINEGKAEDFDNLIEEFYPDGLSETALNDLLWFGDEWIFESLGIEDEEE
jgi:hypothetical protein